MSDWANHIATAVLCFATAWFWSRRGRRQGFASGYLLALDHVEQATKGRLTGKPLPEALKMLRDEAEPT